MNMLENTCVMILSDKSSGSSMLQQELLKSEEVHIVRYTKHQEMETLYWNKAAAVLGLTQERIGYSQLPIRRSRAERELRTFLKRNLQGWEPERFDKHSLFEGWERLCVAFGPVFLEKTPHHLHQRSALDLILEMSSGSKTAFYFVGLVRNPMDALYSSWTRWNADPEVSQHDWVRAYRNLRDFERKAGERVTIVRYEDLVGDLAVVRGIFRFIGVEAGTGVGQDLHRRSVQKWKKNRLYGFQLGVEAMRLARDFGYAEEELTNAGHPYWGLYREAHRIYNADFVKMLKKPVRRVLRRREGGLSKKRGS